MKKQSQHYTFDQDVIQEIEKQAEKEDRSKSYIVNKILRKVFALDKE